MLTAHCQSRSLVAQVANFETALVRDVAKLVDELLILFLLCSLLILELSLKAVKKILELITRQLLDFAGIT